MLTLLYTLFLVLFPVAALAFNRAVECAFASLAILEIGADVSTFETGVTRLGHSLGLRRSTTEVLKFVDVCLVCLQVFVR